MNDILMTGKTIEEHRKWVRWILKKLAEMEIRTKLSKCEFEREEMTCLEHHIGRQRIRPIKDKLEILRTWKTLQKVKEIQIFLGFINFYRKIVSKAAEIMQSLIQLAKKNEKWKWRKIEEKAFEKKWKRNYCRDDYCGHSTQKKQ